MRILDSDKEQEVHSVALYLSEHEAKQLYQRLAELLENPESNGHFHVYGNDVPRREISGSIVTAAKLASLPYTEAERKLFTTNK